MVMHRPDFSDLNDGIDWVNALPPHILAQQERMHSSILREFRRSMFMPFPIPEDIFTASPRRRIQEGGPRSMHPPETHSQGSRRTLNLRGQDGPREWERGSRGQASSHGERNTSNALQGRPQARGSARQQELRPHQQRHLMSREGGIFSDVDNLASLMLNIHRNETSMAVDEFFARGLPLAEAVAEAAMLRAEVQGSSFLETMELRRDEETPRYTTTMVSIRASSSEAPQVTAHVERGFLQPRQRSHHNNSSGSGFDIITGLMRGSRYDDGHVGSRTRRGAGSGDWEINDFSYDNLLRLDNGVRRTGLSPRQLRGMKPVPYADVLPLNDTKSDKSLSKETCAICLETLTSGVMVLRLECRHTFHHGCIIPWLQRSNCCPTCRHEIPRIGHPR